MNKKLWLMLAFALVCTTLSVKAQAQQDITLKCESNDERLKQCQVPGGTRRVTLIRQISGSPCIEGRTWGFNNNYLWVDAGCRAEFRAESRGYFGGGPVLGGGNNAGQTLRCSSDDERRHYCRAETREGVRLVRQVSGSPCIQGQTWGYDRNGIWVDRGCRADFQLGGGNGGYWPGQGGGSGQTIHCASNDERRHFCRVDTRGGVQLTRQASGSPCIEGQTWGYTRDGIWVDRGCRADFQTGYGYSGGGGNWPGQGNQQQDVIYCASDDGRRQYCRTNDYGQIRRVRMVRQRSGSPCIEGQTWGWDQRGVWVDRGCRAEFRVRSR